MHNPSTPATMAALWLLAAMASPPAAAQSGAQQPQTIEETVVTSTLRPRRLLDAPLSVAVITAAQLQRHQANNLREMAGAVANLSFSSGASQGRFFQIRGIGERSQFIDPINPGVGLLIDGMDFGGAANIAALADAAQVEVLRGPQGTRFGANALGGLIYIRSREPADAPQAAISAGAGSISASPGAIDRHSARASLSGPLGDGLDGRLALARIHSDGTIRNIHLHRDDTNRISQRTVQGALRWQTGDTELRLHYLDADSDNGYDAFSLDNDRRTRSDEPGGDAQRSRGLAAHLWRTLPSAWQLHGLATATSTRIDYGYDEDWTWDGFHPDGYSSTDNYHRRRNNQSLDLRLASPDGGAVFGIYAKGHTVRLTRTYTYLAAPFTSDYRQDNLAIYGQLSRATGDWTLSMGARVERFAVQYDDNDGHSIAPAQTMAGGHLGAQYRAAGTLWYARLDRGFKAGGVNSDGAGQLSPDLRAYDREVLHGLELGVRGGGMALSWQLALFADHRDNAQIRQSIARPNAPEQGDACPCEFVEYTANAAGVRGDGLELELRGSPGPGLRWNLALGVLNSRFANFASLSHVNAVQDEEMPQRSRAHDLAGRRLAQAPAYQASAGAEARPHRNWTLWIGHQWQAAHHSSNSHDVQTRPWHLVDARLQWRSDDGAHSLTIWGRNLGNTPTITRAFGSFGNDPRKGYATEPYFQYGDPRQLGLQYQWQYGQ